jgi:hypothetical protein
MKLYSTADAAEALGLSRFVVLNRAKELGLGYERGGGLVFMEAELEHIAKQQPWEGERPMLELLTTEEVAQRTQRATQSVSRIAKDQGIGVKVGRRWYFQEEDVERIAAIDPRGGRPRGK